MTQSEDVTRLLVAWQDGDDAALDQLGPYLYDELHRIAESYMRRERAGNTLQATALVNEAYLRLAGGSLNFSDRSHFFALAARMMRRILVDHARKGQAYLRHLLKLGEVTVEQADGYLVEFDAALEKLEAFDARMAKAIEYRFFGGLSNEEAAEALGISVSTLYEEIKMAKAWLMRELE